MIEPRFWVAMRMTVVAALLMATLSAAHAIDDPNADGAAAPGTVVKNDAAGWMWYGMIPYENAALPDGAAHAGGPGTYAMYTFQGSGVDVYGMRAMTVVADKRTHRVGKVKISIDDQEQATIDVGDTNIDYHAKIFSVKGLAAGNHVIQITPVGGWAVVDSLEITGDSAAGGAKGMSIGGEALKKRLVGYWPCDEGAGAAVKDLSGHGHNGYLMAGAAWTSDAKGGASALSFPKPGGVEIDEPIVDTSASYTVAAWVKLTDLTKYQTFVSVDGGEKSGFFLQYTTDSNRFSLSLDPGRTYSIAAAQTGVWYYLVGVYDSKARASTLYVNGEFQTTSPVPAAYRAYGHTVIGRAKYRGNYTDFVTGSIDEVRLYDTNLSADDVMDLYLAGR
ncbi:hypothetical protein CCAX7_003960 [Capsulimonas corticalis]|uniref:Uncharacterized protein n=1 Tax=Capsulimonas corticalis TaxID=2219043 RepID=A0A402D344_9BACT|nr:LamG domain-containing protein [Capsulimonas corticalis]BDI28345.1 hypothetical protein CCAX7_003960 [Capsulimonas corticalis]